MSSSVESVVALMVFAAFWFGLKTGRACSWCPHHMDECPLPHARTRRRR